MKVTQQPLDQLFCTLAEALQTGVIVMDRDGSAVFVNRAARVLLELPLSPGEQDDMPEALLEFLRPGPEGRKPAGREGDLELPSGRSLQLRKLAIVTDKGRTVVVLEDKRAADALQATLALANHVHTRSSLRSQVHDIKAPLNALAINLELLRRSIELDKDRDYPTDRLNERLAATDTLQREVARLGRSLDSFLNYAVAGDPGGKKARKIDVRTVARAVARLVRPSAKEAGIRFEIRLPEQPARVLADGGQIEQALLNVTLNALEAQGRGGEVRVIIEKVQGHVWIAVEDDGPGIPEHLLERVFEMNFTTKECGKGIGLTVARARVEAQGGRLELANRPGRGTTVRILLDEAGE